MNRLAELQIAGIKKAFLFLRKFNPSILDREVTILFRDKKIISFCQSNNFRKLGDIEKKVERLAGNTDRLRTLSNEIHHVCEANCPNGKYVDRYFFTVGQNGDPDIIVSKNLLAGNDCCLCVTLWELPRISEGEFIDLMKNGYKNNINKELEQPRIESWRDEYRQLVQVFIPFFEKRDKSVLNFYILFELKLPANLTFLDSGEYYLADAVIVGEDGFVVLEFKQMTSDTINLDANQAYKYTRRLNYHKIGRSQHKRYTYVVYTKENDNQVYKYTLKKNLWYSNSLGVAFDLFNRYFSRDVPCEDVEKWFHAGFRQKTQKTTL